MNAWETVTLVVPVKHTSRGKSRLTLPVPLRRNLALAFCEDTVHAAVHAQRVERVLVVTDDDDVAKALVGLPVVVVPETGRGHLAAVAQGWGVASDWAPERGVAVLPADLPALQTRDLDAALEHAWAGQSGFVPDSEGSGTTLLVAPAEATSVLHYGPGSALAHEQAGLRRLPASWRLRLDVDAVADLAEVASSGPGPRTAAVLRQAGWDLSTTGHGSARSTSRLQMPSLT